MSKQAPWIVALIVAAICVGLLVRDHNRQLVVASLQAKVADLTKMEAHQKKAMKAPITKGDAVQLEGTRQTPDEGKPSARLARIFDPTNEMRNDPAYSALWRRMQLRRINRQYGDVLATLNLSADQLANLKNLMIDREEALLDARDASKNLPAAESRAAIFQAEDEVNKEIDALVGPGVMSQFASTAEVYAIGRTIQSQEGMDFTAAGLPLSAEQVSALADIYANFQIPERLKGTPDFDKLVGAPADPVTGLTPLNQALLAQAAQVLSPAQLPILRQSLIDENLQQAFAAGK
jgi:hypothetical protein